MKVRSRGVRELGPVGVGHEDASVRCDENVVGIGEVRGRIAPLTGCAQDHEHLALGTELDYGAAPVCRVGVDLQLPGSCETGVRDPDVTFSVHVHPVGPNEHTRSKALDHVPVGIQLDDGIHIGGGA